jgi:sortase B
VNDGGKARARGDGRAGGRRFGYFRRLALLLCSGMLVFSGWNLASELLEEKKSTDYYDELGREFLTTPESAGARPAPAPAAPGAEAPPGDEPPEEPDEPQTSYVEDYAPDIWPVVDFEGLRGVNADTEAWLLCVGTNINYPVVHSGDNTEYLTTMFDGRVSKAGALFIDMRNSRGFSDRNTIIYGHNMRNHSMFWTVTQYRNRSFYNAHPAMRLITEVGNYEIQLFAGFVADASEAEVWRTHFAGEEYYMAWIASLFERGGLTDDIELSPSDRVVTLSTCTYEFTGARYVVMGKLVPVDASGEPSAGPPVETPGGNGDGEEIAGGEEPGPGPEPAPPGEEPPSGEETDAETETGAAEESPPEAGEAEPDPPVQPAPEPPPETPGGPEPEPEPGTPTATPTVNLM